MIIRVPDRDSVFGWAARHTPHRTHVWFKKYIERQKDAGKPGHAPYPVVYDKVVSVRGMRDWVTRKGFKIETEYATHHFVGVFGPFAPVVKWGLRLVSKLSAGPVERRVEQHLLHRRRVARTLAPERADGAGSGGHLPGGAMPPGAVSAALHSRA